MIRFESVSKSYGALEAVRDLDLEIRPGEVFGLLGPNGAGKTTTMRMLVGLLFPTRGTIRVAGHDLAEDPRAAKRRIGFVPDRPYLFDALTGGEYLEFVGGLWGLAPELCRRRAGPLLDRFRIAAAVDRLVEGYSHGMKQKLALTAAFLHEPEVAVIDEPMVGLDPHSAREAKALFGELADAGRTVVLSTHQLEVAERVCDRIGVISEGRLVALGTMDELRSAGGGVGIDLEAIFLRLTEEAAEEAVETAPSVGEPA